MARQSERSASTVQAIKAAGRDLFSEKGFDAVSVEAIVERAGVAKGGYYHHFASKRELLDRVVDDVQGELAAEMAARARPGAVTAGSIATSVGDYLREALRPSRRRILLVEGPAVLGWERWRAIDDRHFAAAMRSAIGALLGPAALAEEADSATRLTLGAIMEAALACGAATDPEQAALGFTATLERMLAGLRTSDPAAAS